MGNGTMLNGGWTKRIKIDARYNRWFFYAATFNGRIGTPIMNDFKLYVGKCDDASLAEPGENNTTAGKPDSSGNPYSTILYSTSNSATDKNFGQSLYKLVLGAPAGESPSVPGYYSDFYIWNYELNSIQLNTVFYGGPKNIFDIQTVPHPMDWFNWQNNLSNNISNRPDFGFTQTDTLSLNTTYNHFVSWDVAQPGKPCGGIPPGLPPEPPTEPPVTITHIGCNDLEQDPQTAGMWNYTSKYSHGNLFIPSSCMSGLGESLITKVGFELYVPKQQLLGSTLQDDYLPEKEWIIEDVDMWIFMHTTANTYHLWPDTYLNILVSGCIDDHVIPPLPHEQAYMDGIKNHTQVLNNGKLNFTQAAVLDGEVVDLSSGLSNPETREYYKKYVYFDLEIPYAYDGQSSLSVNINTKNTNSNNTVTYYNNVKWGVTNRVKDDGVIDNNPGIFGYKNTDNEPYTANTSIEVNRPLVPKISLVTTTNTTTVVYNDYDINDLSFGDDIPLDFSSRITFDKIPFSEQIILNSELIDMSLNGKTIIGIKYTFKNSLNGTNSNGGNGEKYTLNEQKLTIRYTNDDYYLNTYEGIVPQGTESDNLTDFSFSLILDNINDGAVKNDTTPQEFNIYFPEFDLPDQFNQNIVLIWENKSTNNSNAVSDGGMSTLRINLESSDENSYKVYTFYRDNAAWKPQRLNEIPVISFIYKD